MWYDSIEAFWDGLNHLVLGSAVSAAGDGPALGSAPIGVFAAIDERAPQTLVGVIDPLNAPVPWHLFNLPPTHRFVRLRRGGHAEGTNEVALVLSSQPMRG